MLKYPYSPSFTSLCFISSPFSFASFPIERLACSMLPLCSGKMGAMYVALGELEVSGTVRERPIPGCGTLGESLCGFCAEPTYTGISYCEYV